MAKPDIQTAIPKRRYQIGEFAAIILGEVKSGGDEQYRYIMALVKDGTSEPCLYVTTESNPSEQAAEGRFRVRVILGDESKEMGSADEWGDIQTFSLYALGIAVKLYQLTDEQPTRLM